MIGRFRAPEAPEAAFAYFTWQSVDHRREVVPVVSQGLGTQSRALLFETGSGELCALNGDGVPVFSRLQAAMDEGRTDQLVFFAHQEANL